MQQSAAGPTTGPAYHVSKFVVPAPSRAEFLDRVMDTREVLRTQSGFIRDLILEQQSGPGEFNFVILAEWMSPDSIEQAGVAVMRHHAEIGFNRAETLARLEIRTDIADYAALSI